MRTATSSVVEQASRAEDFDSIDRKFVFHTQGGEAALLDSPGLLDELVEAILGCNAVRLSYSRFDGSVEDVDISPLSILVYEHQLYVIGRTSDQRLHPYRFARINKAHAAATRFTYPARAEYDPATLLRDSLGIFVDPKMPVAQTVVKLSARWAGYAQIHRWHPTQQVEVVEDGVIVRLRVRQCPELETWVLGFADDAEVIEPMALKETVARRLGLAAAKYGA